MGCTAGNCLFLKMKEAIREANAILDLIQINGKYLGKLSGSSVKLRIKAKNPLF